MFPFKRGFQPGLWLRSWTLALAFFAVGFAPTLLQAQACGDNSTVDILGAQTAAGARAFLARLKAAVRSNDRKQIAGMIDYPMLVTRSGTHSHIRNQKTFLARYSRIFTPAIREAILQQTAKCLFGNDQGAMVGHGEVWFREQKAGEWKIVTINESTRAH